MPFSINKLPSSSLEEDLREDDEPLNDFIFPKNNTIETEIVERERVVSS